ncbi:Glycosyltransferases involved in cell wall biogenesis [Planctomycetales bacterium 10988]|nr:Glycosyltransferases involved in cell wall biogenesis [Planctomycetales bacterium 10988]
MELTGFILAATACLFASIPTIVFLRNLPHFHPAPSFEDSKSTFEEKKQLQVSVLIPARNEETSIGPAVESVLANQAVELEVIVLDDHSEDRTADVVQELAAKDNRVRLEEAPALPEGWCGKQHACWQLAHLATFDNLAFLDADVRLAPDALARSVALMEAKEVDLLSGFPRQITGTFFEKLLIPLIHFILLGFLSLQRMRSNPQPVFAAGCGQFFLTNKNAYWQAEGHKAIRLSLHDGLKLPRSYRRAGLKTDLFNATDLATCRMYRTAGEVWSGLGKNATEGVANSTLILPVTIILFLGQLLPFLLIPFGLAGGLCWAGWLMTGIDLCIVYLPRFWAAVAFRQSWLGAILHPLGILCFLMIQWVAWIRSLLGVSAHWKGRPYPAT